MKPLIEALISVRYDCFHIFEVNMIPFIVYLKVTEDVIGRKHLIFEVNSHHIELRNELDPNSQREHLHLDLILYLIREHIDRVAIRRGEVSAVVKEL